MAQSSSLPQTWDNEADVVVVGFGAAGVAASVTAHDLGAKVDPRWKRRPKGRKAATRASPARAISTRHRSTRPSPISPRCADPTPCRSPWCGCGPRKCARTTPGSRASAATRRSISIQPVGIEFPDLPGADCVHKFHDGPTYGYSYTWKLFERLVKATSRSRFCMKRRGESLIQHGVRRKSSVCGPHGAVNPLNVKARRGGRADLRRLREQPGDDPRTTCRACPTATPRARRTTRATASRMAMSVGADLWHMNNYAGPSMALEGPGVPDHVFDAGAALRKQPPGGMIVVGPDGKRFADEKYKTSHGKIPVARALAAAVRPCPMFMIFDHTLFASGPLYDKEPTPRLDADRRALRLERRQQAPNWRRAGSSTPTRSPALAQRLWARPRRRWQETVSRWNAHCEAGTIRSFGRTMMLAPDRDSALLCGRALALDAQHAGRPADATTRGQIVRPDGTPDPAALQCGRTRVDLQLPVPGHRQHRRMPGVRPHRGRNAAAETPWDGG